MIEILNKLGTERMDLMMEYYLATKKEWNPDFCNKIDSTGDHYAQWNKPDI